MRIGEWAPLYRYRDLFESLFYETKMKLPDGLLHNLWINHCKGSDTTPVYLPSQFFKFPGEKEDVVCNIDPREGIPPECAVFIHDPDDSVTKSLLSVCPTISKQSPITHLYIHMLSCDDVIH